MPPIIIPNSKKIRPTLPILTQNLSTDTDVDGVLFIIIDLWVTIFIPKNENKDKRIVPIICIPNDK